MTERIKYTEEEKSFMREFIPGHSHKEIRDEFTRRFRPITCRQVAAYCKNNKISTGHTGRFRKGQTPWSKGKRMQTRGRMAETQFKKGNVPHNWRPVGSERVNVDGYIEIKVSEPKKWMLKHRYVWQQHYGEIPKGSMVIFKDGNRLNTDIDNLMLITQGINGRLSRLGLQDAREAEAMEEAVMIAKIQEKIRRLERPNDGRRDQQKNRRVRRNAKNLRNDRKRNRRRAGERKDPEAERHEDGEGGSRPESGT